MKFEPHHHMDASNFSYNSHSFPAVSSSGRYIAYISGSRLVLRSTSTFATKRLIELGPTYANAVRWIKWDSTCSTDEDRLAIASSDEIQIFSVGSGDESNSIGTILPGVTIYDVEWASRNDTVRLAVFSSDLLTVTLWSADESELNILSPKIASIIPRTDNSISILSRLKTVDVVETIAYSPQGTVQLKPLPLKGVLDAKQIKWSPSGLYLAAVDNYAIGYSVTIWATDGTLLQTYDGPYNSMYKTAGLGARCLSWVACLHKELLLVGDCQEQVAVLDPLINQCSALLLHGTVYSDIPVWEEWMNPEYVMIYRVRSLPFYPNRVKSARQGFVPGISRIEVSPAGSHVATINSSTPNLVWIWSISQTSEVSFDLVAVLCQSSPILQIAWESVKGILLYVLSAGGSVLGIWNSQSSMPVLQEWNDLDGSLLGASWCSQTTESGIIPRLAVWTAREFSFSDVSDSAAIDLKRTGSPQLLAGDDSNVVDMVNSIQQNEWVQDMSAMENTFHQKNSIK